MFTLKIKAKHRHRVYLNQKYKQRDRSKVKRKFMPGWKLRNWMYHHFDKDWTWNRRKSHTDTGFGIAYEHNPDAQKY